MADKLAMAKHGWFWRGLTSETLVKTSCGRPQKIDYITGTCAILCPGPGHLRWRDHGTLAQNVMIGGGVNHSLLTILYELTVLIRENPSLLTSTVSTAMVKSFEAGSVDIALTPWELGLPRLHHNMKQGGEWSATRPATLNHYQPSTVTSLEH